jgi:hypothetical protein
VVRPPTFFPSRKKPRRRSWAPCCRGSSSPRNKSTSWNEVFFISTVYWYWRLQSIIAKDLSSSLFQSGLLEESTSNLSIPQLRCWCFILFLCLSYRRQRRRLVSVHRASEDGLLVGVQRQEVSLSICHASRDVALCRFTTRVKTDFSSAFSVEKWAWFGLPPSSPLGRSREGGVGLHVVAGVHCRGIRVQVGMRSSLFQLYIGTGDYSP